MSRSISQVFGKRLTSGNSAKRGHAGRGDGGGHCLFPPNAASVPGGGLGQGRRISSQGCNGCEDGGGHGPFPPNAASVPGGGLRISSQGCNGCGDGGGSLTWRTSMQANTTGKAPRMSDLSLSFS
jgi:hypothetical protein